MCWALGQGLEMGETIVCPLLSRNRQTQCFRRSGPRGSSTSMNTDLLKMQMLGPTPDPLTSNPWGPGPAICHLQASR